jgi:NADPH:quinone reductase-like Zn-dependent oxidoreductase
VSSSPRSTPTAHYLTRSTYPVRRGDDVLVHAAAGGMGLFHELEPDLF